MEAWTWWPYGVLAALLTGTWFVGGMGALAVAAVALTFLVSGFFVGSVSESRKRGVLAGLAAALPVALFFLWLLKLPHHQRLRIGGILPVYREVRAARAHLAADRQHRAGGLRAPQEVRSLS